MLHNNMFRNFELFIRCCNDAEFINILYSTYIRYKIFPRIFVDDKADPSDTEKLDKYGIPYTLLHNPYANVEALMEIMAAHCDAKFLVWLDSDEFILPAELELLDKFLDTLTEKDGFFVFGINLVQLIRYPTGPTGKLYERISENYGFILPHWHIFTPRTAHYTSLLHTSGYLVNPAETMVLDFIRHWHFDVLGKSYEARKKKYEVSLMVNPQNNFIIDYLPEDVPEKLWIREVKNELIQKLALRYEAARTDFSWADFISPPLEGERRIPLPDKREKMRIGILDFSSYDDYGMLFECYALNYFLNRSGFDALNITCTSSKDINQKACTDVGSRKIDFKRFQAKHIRMSKPYAGFKTLTELNAEFDTFLCSGKLVINGNPGKNRPDYLPYFLAFANKDKCRLSYSASLTKAIRSADTYHQALAKYFLFQFLALGVAEESDVRLLKDDFDLSAVPTANPVFLLNKDSWCDITVVNQHSKKVIYYANDSVVKNFIEKEIIYANNIDQYNVVDFLSAIRDAEFVITDDFHVICFSLIFQKRFVCILNNDDEDIEGICSLLSKFNIPSEHMLILDHSPNDITNLSEINALDYTQITPLLQQYAKESKNWLLENLKRCKQIPCVKADTQEMFLLLIREIERQNDMIIKNTSILQDDICNLKGENKTLFDFASSTKEILHKNRTLLNGLKECTLLPRNFAKFVVFGILTVISLGHSDNWRFKFNQSRQWLISFCSKCKKACLRIC